MQVHLDSALVVAAHQAAQQLLESGEVRAIISGLGFDPSAEFVILRELAPGLLPLGRFEEGKTVFYICGETGTTENNAEPQHCV